MKNVKLFKELYIDGDDYSGDFSKTSYFFEKFDFFIESLLGEIPKKIKPVHYARVLSRKYFPYYENLFLSNDYKINNNFRSNIVESYLRKKYANDKIIVNIYKISNVEKMEIELFVIENILTEKELKNESLKLRHFAIESKESISNILQKALTLNEFKNVGGGNNKEEKSSTLYYEKSLGKNQLIRLELFKKDK